ncbi:MAG TPA: GNAT family N-acetyltransferase [Pyrinomonadaceae bacterium]|nr:GNAT family N-acetyltransferase [Pyrinomonadaceae bacterium]
MEIRKITPDDLPGVISLMRSFAEFEDLGDYCEITEERLNDAVFGNGAFVEAAVADEGGNLAGYAIFYPHFASFRGQKGFYLEDIFVEAGQRGRGIGILLLKFIAKAGDERGFERIDFQVLDWNTAAIDFYKKLGADRDDSERHFKFTDAAFKLLAT